jgi:hypothetical protein
MLHIRKISLIALGVGILAASITTAHADQYTDRLKTDPTAIKRPLATQPMMTEPQYTGSLKRTPIMEQGFNKCSYDAFYWNTIYACDPAHQGNEKLSGP